MGNYENSASTNGGSSTRTYINFFGGWLVFDWAGGFGKDDVVTILDCSRASVVRLCLHIPFPPFISV